MRVLDAGSFLDNIHMLFTLLYLKILKGLEMSTQFEMGVCAVLCAVLGMSLF